MGAEKRSEVGFYAVLVLLSLAIGVTSYLQYRGNGFCFLAGTLCLESE